jgi:hypothetical protein
MLLASTVLALGLAGCAAYQAPVRPPQGLLFTTITAPLSTNFKSTPVCTKRGVAETTYLRDPLFTGLSFAWGEAGVKEAAMNGGLTAVEYADYEYMLAFGIFGKFRVIAYGQ